MNIIRTIIFHHHRPIDDQVVSLKVNFSLSNSFLFVNYLFTFLEGYFDERTSNYECKTRSFAQLTN